MRATLPLLLVLLPIAPAGASIYRCTDDRGNPVFSDLGCNSSEQLELTPLQTLEFAPADAKAPHLRREDNAQRREAARRRQQAATEQARVARRHEHACNLATELIAQIRDKRRQGYDIGESTRLRAQLNAAKRDRRRFCS